MSAMPPIATESVRRNEPTLRAKTRREQSQQGSALFDNLVGSGEQRGRHFEVERLGGPEVDDKLEPGSAIDRHFGWLSSVENTPGKDADPSIGIGHAVAVADQAASHGIISTPTDHRKCARPSCATGLRSMLARGLRANVGLSGGAPLPRKIGNGTPLSRWVVRT